MNILHFLHFLQCTMQQHPCYLSCICINIPQDINSEMELIVLCRVYNFISLVNILLTDFLLIDLIHQPTFSENMPPHISHFTKLSCMLIEVSPLFTLVIFGNMITQFKYCRLMKCHKTVISMAKLNTADLNLKNDTNLVIQNYEYLST